MKEMSNIYFRMSDRNLLRLRSQKSIRIKHIEARHMGYFDLQEVRTLVQQIKWIDAVLSSRADQLPMPL